jgi:type IV secretory pathway TrbD component
LTALRALNRNLYTLAHAGSLCCRNRCEALILGLLAWLAAFGFILQTLVVKKDLLAASPDKILPAVYALDRAIIELHFGMTPLSVGRTRTFSL